VEPDANLERLIEQAQAPDAVEETALLAELERRMFGRETPPIRLSRYLLLQRIGKGGFGSVFAAYDPELDRRVAIKLIHGREGRRQTAEQRREVLLRESQALAQFCHPNVVTIHDVGTYDLRDHPDVGALGLVDVEAFGVFMVMEYLEGPTLADWARDELKSGRGATARIVAKLVEVGRGLAAAHAEGLVHRDFKPSNVIVGDDGRPRVLDFGLAVAATQSDALDPSPGGPVRIEGTPMYMAPEQFEGRPADPRSDQYAFCVTAYEALCGRQPFERGDLSTLRKLKRSGTIAEPERLRRLPRWLGRVLSRGLTPAPAGRYDTLDRLLDELERGLARRRRVVVSVVFGGLVLGAVALGWALGPGRAAACIPAEDALVGIWDDALRERLRRQFAHLDDTPAGTVTSIEGALDDYANSWRAASLSACQATVVEGRVAAPVYAERTLCLDRRRRRLGGLVRLMAEGDAEVLRHALEGVSTLPRIEACLAETDPVRVPALADEVRTLLLDIEADLARADGLITAGKFDEAIEEASAAERRAADTGVDSAHAAALTVVARARRKAGQLEQAQAAIDAAIGAAERSGDWEASNRALIVAVRISTDRGHDVAADRLALIAQARVARHEPRSPAAGDLGYNVGLLRMTQRRYPEALEALERAREIRAEVFGPRHHLVASTHNTTGNVYQSDGDPDRAREHHEQALSIWTEAFGPEHPDIARVLNNLGNDIKDQGDYGAALETYERALATYEATFPANHPSLGIIHHNLGLIHELFGHRRRGLEHYRRAAVIKARSLGDDHPLMVSTLRNEATTAMFLGELDLAQSKVEQALGLSRRRFDAGHGEVLDSLDVQARVAAARGEVERARAHIEEAEHLAAAAGKDIEGEVGHLEARAALAEAERRSGELVDLRRRLHVVLNSMVRAGHPRVLWAEAELGTALVAHDELASGLEHLRASLPRLERQVNPRHPDLVALHLAIATAVAATDPASAANHRARAAEIAKTDEVGPRWKARVEQALVSSTTTDGGPPP